MRERRLRDLVLALDAFVQDAAKLGHVLQRPGTELARHFLNGLFRRLDARWINPFAGAGLGTQRIRHMYDLVLARDEFTHRIGIVQIGVE